MCCMPHTNMGALKTNFTRRTSVSLMCVLECLQIVILYLYMVSNKQKMQIGTSTNTQIQNSQIHKYKYVENWWCVWALAASGGGAHCLSAIRPHSANSLSTSKVVLDRKSNKNYLKRIKKHKKTPCSFQ